MGSISFCKFMNFYLFACLIVSASAGIAHTQVKFVQDEKDGHPNLLDVVPALEVPLGKVPWKFASSSPYLSPQRSPAWAFFEHIECDSTMVAQPLVAADAAVSHFLTHGGLPSCIIRPTETSVGPAPAVGHMLKRLEMAIWDFYYFVVAPTHEVAWQLLTLAYEWPAPE